MKPRIRYSVPPWIHPEDAAAAIFARLRQRQERRGVSEQRVVEDLFIATLANQRPWSAEQIWQIQESSKDHGFCERFASALEKGRTPMFDKYDVIILSNWRQLLLSRNAPKSLHNLPGLRDWTPKAVAQFFEGSDMDLFLDTASFMTRRKRLGLKGRRPYVMKTFPLKAKQNPTRKSF